MARPILILVILSHWVACILASVGGYKEATQSPEQSSKFFKTVFNTDHHSEYNAVSERLVAYLMAFIETLYMLIGCLDNPLGDGSPRERNFGSLLIVAVFGPIGCVGVAKFIAAIVREQALAYVLESRHAENKAFIGAALRILNVPKELRRRVYSLHYFQRMSHDFEAFEVLFGRRHLSKPLESALRVYLYNESVLYAKYFKSKDPNYIVEVVRILEDCIFLPGDYVIRCGEVGTQMYFVARGELTVLVPHRRQTFRTDIKYANEVAKLKKGDYFGDIALLEDCTRTAWVRADSYCLLSRLTRNAIQDIWHYFPSERASLVDNIKQRMSTVAHRHGKSLWKKVALDSHAMQAWKTTASKNSNASHSVAVAEQGWSTTASEASVRPDPTYAGAFDNDRDPDIIDDFIARSSLQHNQIEAMIEQEYAGVANASELDEKEVADLPNEVHSVAELKAAAHAVEDTCEVLLHGHQSLRKRMEVLQNRVAVLAKGQESLAKLLGFQSAPDLSITSPSKMLGCKEQPIGKTGGTEQPAAKAVKLEAVKSEAPEAGWDVTASCDDEISRNASFAPAFTNVSTCRVSHVASADIEETWLLAQTDEKDRKTLQSQKPTASRSPRSPRSPQSHQDWRSPQPSGTLDGAIQEGMRFTLSMGTIDAGDDNQAPEPQNENFVPEPQMTAEESASPVRRIRGKKKRPKPKASAAGKEDAAPLELRSKVSGLNE
jgi:hypothetical protein